MPEVHEINDIRELSARRLLWNSLLADTPDACFFHSLDWLRTYWDHFGGPQRLRALIVSAAGRPIGILPLIVRSELSAAGPIRVLTYPSDGWATFYSPIGPNPTATLLVGLRHVEATRRDWDVLDLGVVDVARRDRGRTERAMRMAGFHAKERTWMKTGVVELDGSWEHYWGSRSEAWQRDVERAERRLRNRHCVSYIRYRPQGAARGDGDPRWDLFEATLSIADEQGWSMDTSAAASRPCSVVDYLRDAHAAAARAGGVDLNLLLIDDQPAAFAYNYHREGRVHGLRVGAHPRFAAQSAGLVLRRMMLEDGFLRGDALFDWGVGSVAAAGPWLTSVRQSWRFTHYPTAAPRAQLLRFSRWVRSFAASPAVAVSPVACDGMIAESTHSPVAGDRANSE